MIPNSLCLNSLPGEVKTILALYIQFLVIHIWSELLYKQTAESVSPEKDREGEKMDTKEHPHQNPEQN